MIIVKPDNRTWVIIAIVIVLAIFVVWFGFKQSKKGDEILQYQKTIIELTEKLNAKSDSIISLQKTRIQTNTIREKEIITRYEKIPADVNALDREQLRKQVTDY